MERTGFSGEKFNRRDFASISDGSGDFEDCEFHGCDFSEAELAGSCFTDCLFDSCNLSSASLKSASLKNVRFLNCKVLGVDFEKCNPFLFSVSFENCILDFSIFGKLRVRETTFKGCSLREADFRQTDLTGSSFDGCDLRNALFVRTVLEKVDFRTASNFAFAPEANRVKKARFSVPAVFGLLLHHDIDIDLS